MNERMPAWALNRLLPWALRPVAVPNGNSDGRLRPSRPIGSLARTMTPRLSRSACNLCTPGTCTISLKASLSVSSSPLCSLGHAVTPLRISHCSNLS